ncbi:MAG: exodeoxyribonuclease V subunit beta [Paraglaciecola sp.]|uniref:exodeoxyribonuclease V subunit beta n=1 Tax=Paraglaciecola sp. TaxID=1920173 RepID=UPI00273E2909|nr:exodeoxyribonuclease V subunit beta [Paraglaciecola sp.]MDP5030526.1 exodeoxyribonuclease V subunit beta [Paraglaciecola sp.]MDP5129584.1 exodeoxyribonuclease V subunit beta [Paraglaciecola sp.]
MQPLNTLTFPLNGASLIEASAGTGKTYTIVNLYLRQLLGHHCQALNVDQILVVTFTNAATAELKERIRQRLQRAYLDFYRGESNDSFIQALYEQIDNSALATQRLALASKQMDEAAIFTIHGFCQRALTEHAFESGAMYEQQFILDESEWLKLAVADYWRTHIVTQPADIQSLLLEIWSQPDKLLMTLQPLLNRKAAPQSNIAISEVVALQQDYSQQVADIKRWWLDNNIASLLQQGQLKANVVVGKPATFEAMQRFCESSQLYPTFCKEGWLLYGPANLAKALKKGASLPDIDFSRFEHLAALAQQVLDGIKLAFCQDALVKVAHNLATQKNRLQLISPDDLLTHLGHALSPQNGEEGKNNELATALRARYPAVLIDEFQDTDPVQYRIFQQIYAQAAAPLATELAQNDSNSPKSPCWIMIGDPKQAIYGFRGADIVTYLHAKKQVSVQQQFTLDTNWRSTPQLIAAVNTLFMHNQQPESQKSALSFYPVKAGKDETGLLINGQAQPSLDLWHLCSDNDKPIAKGQAQQSLAHYCARQIATILQENSTVASRAVLAGDCCVLVRNRNEAQLVKLALQELDIASVFLARKSVFASQTALDCYRLLSALSQPGDDRAVKTALLTELFAISAFELDSLFSDDNEWQNIIALFHHWHQDWQKYGLMMAMNKVISHFRIEQKALRHFSDGLRRVTDLRHVLELLQQRSLEVQGHGQLMHWFSQCLQDPDHSNDKQQLRLETDANLVQISTLHASKGLQYPLVFIPFGNSYKSAQSAVFHADEGQLLVDFLGQEKAMKVAEQERLEEDVRLLYVALTRAEYYCALGVWHNISDDRRRRSAFLETALGAILLPQGVEVSDELIARYIQQLSQHASQQGSITYSSFYAADLPDLRLITQTDNSPPTFDAEPVVADLVALQLTKPIERQWRLTSYSAISQQQSHLEVLIPGMDEGRDAVQEEQIMTATERELNAFTFEKGANAGSFLHGILENIDFTQVNSLAEVIKEQSLKFAIGKDWQEPLYNWLSDLLMANIATSQSGAVLSLAQLARTQIKVEMEFYMPLKQVQVAAFNQLINHFMPHSIRQYEFAQLNGMLKGFIDLTFAFEGKYYVADYKSNHLGLGYDHYQLASLERAMQEHDYHLQAILYTLALHRWLKQQLPHYRYQDHMGGAYYLFLRGMHSELPQSGVYYYRADEAFICALDALFNGEPLPDFVPTHTTKSEPPKPLGDQTDQGQLDLW